LPKTMKARRDTRTDANVAKGEAHMENARKAAATSLFKWKPDWETAAREYREAVKMFQSSNQDRHLAALLESIESSERIEDYNTAARHLEAAGKIYDENLSSSPQKDSKRNAHQAWVRCATFYRKNAQHDKAAAILLRAATALAEISIDDAIPTVRDSYRIFFDEERVLFGGETFKKCVSLVLQYDKFDVALEIMREHNGAYLKNLKEFENDLYKNELGIIVIFFHQEKYQEAHDEFKRADNLGKFNTSPEWEAADSLFAAYKTGSAKNLEVAVKMSPFQYLPNRLSRLARKLKLSQAVLQSGGAKLAGDIDLDSDNEHKGEPDEPLDLS